MKYRGIIITAKCKMGHTQSKLLTLIKGSKDGIELEDDIIITNITSGDEDTVINACDTCGSEIEWSAAVWGS